MNKEIWRMYGVRTGKICAHLCIALAACLLAGLPALAGAAMACSAAAIVLLACCERKGERSVVRMSFACVVFVFALAVLVLRQAGG